MAKKQISRFPLNEKFSGFSGLSGHVPNYAYSVAEPESEPPFVPGFGSGTPDVRSRNIGYSSLEDARMKKN